VQINADLKVGALEETITVSGETPIVDVQNAARQQILSGELVANTPAARSWNGIMLLVPGVTGDPNTVQLTPGMVTFGIHGGPTSEGRLQVDGMNVGASRGGGGVSGYSVDTANVQEITFRTSGGLGEAETGGPSMNIVPKTGGNELHGTFYTAGVGETMVDSNYTDALKTAGLSTPGQLQKLWDFSLGVGGPILRDRIWFYGIAREEGSRYTVEEHALADARRALRTVRSRAAEWRVDPERLGVLGFSAGGELAALAAMRGEPARADAPDPIERESSRPAFQVLVYPGRSQNILPTPQSPPAFLLCGADDRPDISEGLASVYLRFKQAGVPAELHVYSGVGHGFGVRASNTGPVAHWLDRVREWMDGRGLLKE